MAIYWALKHQRVYIMIVSPTNAQVLKLQKEICKVLENTPFVFRINSSPGQAHIQLINETYIIFKSAESADSIRGYSIDYLLLDEFAFIKPDTYNTIIAPTMTVKGKKTLFCSTPKGKNLFHKFFQYGKSKLYPKWISFKSTYLQNPFSDKDFIEEQRKTLSDWQFRQEYLAEFVDADSIFKGIENIAVNEQITHKRENEQYYIGIDVGFLNDSTVISIFNQHNQQVYVEELKSATNQQQIDKIIEINNMFNPIVIMIEKNNQGIVIIQQLYELGLSNIQEFTTTNSSKNYIINNFIADYNQKKLTLCNNQELINQFNDFTFKMNEVGTVKYFGQTEHDDIVMATVISHYAFKQYENGLHSLAFN
jgi:hypothetical protein